MKVSYSLKHAATKFENPLLGTETTDGMYADVCLHGTMFTVIMIGEYSYWFTSEYGFLGTHNKNGYHNDPGDRRFAVFPSGSVITFLQDSL